MDDNPWDAPSPSPAPSKSDSPPSPTTSPRVSFSPDEDERPTWGTDSPPLKDVEEEEEPAEKLDEEEDEEREEGVTEQQQQEDEGAAGKEEDSGSVKDEGEEEAEAKPAAAAEETADVAPPPPASDKEDGPAETSAPSSPEPAASPALAPKPFPEYVPTLPSTLPDPEPSSTNDGPPMDSFSDDDFDDGGFSEPASAAAATVEGGDDDGFSDFGEAAGEGEGDDDFGDFGDFGDAAPLDESAFDAPGPSTFSPPAPVPAAAPTFAAPPTYPPLRLDLTNATSARRTVAPQLKEFCAAVWTYAEDAVNDEPERQVERVGQVLVTESSGVFISLSSLSQVGGTDLGRTSRRKLLNSVSTLPQLRPLDWRRSKIRREHLIAMGIPVNLDDTAEPKYSSLSLAPGSRHRLAPLATSHSPTRSSSAPPLSSSALPFSASASSLPGSRSFTPFADRERTRAGLAPPPLDKAKAEELIGIKEEDLTLMSLDRLREVGEELDRFSVEASGVLTHALMLREKEGQDKEVYNGMIQDLVIAAAKMKTSSAGGTAVKRSGSGRWGR